MGLTLTLLGAIWLGYEVSLRLWGQDEALPWAERSLYAVTLGVLFWLGTAWIISGLHVLVRETLLVRTALLLGGAALLVIRRRPDRPKLNFDRRSVAVVLVAAVPLLLWADYVLWRGSIAAVLNHDALSYHLPKAIFYVRAHGYVPLMDLAYLIPPRPSNYEILLADAIALDGSDRLTEWPGIIFYAGLLLAGVALAQRWWNAELESSLATALAVGAAPVAILHAGAHKNDLIFGFLASAAIVVTGRYLLRPTNATLALALGCLVALCGTKRHGLIVALCLAPWIAWKVLRPFSIRRIAIATTIAVMAGMLLGGMDEIGRYLAARRTAGQSVGSTSEVQAAASESITTYQYGDWENLWQAPYLLLYAPFSTDVRGLSVPWLDQPMFWQRYELYFSHFGIHFTLAALAFPFIVFASRRRVPESRLDRLALTASTLSAFVLLLPVHFVPRGLYSIYLPRFVFFILPVLFAWTIPPLVEMLSRRRRAYATLAVVAASLTFIAYATSFSINDRFVPIEYVLWASEHPDNRVIPFFPNRAPSVVDGMAGTRDSIALDAGNAAWLYPAFGEKLERRIVFIPPGDGPPSIPDVDWIVIERSWNAIWGDPDFKDLSQARRFLVQGRMQPEDRRVLMAVARDPRYQLVFNDPRLRQAVFKRVR